ncbi:hypothetical protein CRI94_11540 [Longibacter salinarum]|uniref:Uncharacterized protein n=1 Tax=Longibacter salinarum TaxID=1850348 RepID=A0A2A8CX89_9BACT|nr:hypothetical protein CRI94_11540 [Longibacter salinarum]
MIPNGRGRSWRSAGLAATGEPRTNELQRAKERQHGADDVAGGVARGEHLFGVVPAGGAEMNPVVDHFEVPGEDLVVHDDACDTSVHHPLNWPLSDNQQVAFANAVSIHAVVADTEEETVRWGVRCQQATVKRKDTGRLVS